MLEAFRLGGWGMYPTLIAGLFLFAASIRYARQPERARLPFLGLLAIVTMSAGTLGFVTGLMKTLEFAAGDPKQGEYIASGTFESLHNIALALTFIVLSSIIAAVGASKAARQNNDVISRVPVRNEA